MRCSRIRGMVRIGLIYPATDPTSPAIWSGSPHGLREGFRSIGIEAVPVPCRIPRSVRVPLSLLRRLRCEGRTVAERAPMYVRARSRVIAASLRAVGPLDGVVAMGGEMYDLERVMRGRPEPVATFGDGDFRLFLRFRDSDVHLDGYPIEAVQSWAGRQGAACRRADVACVCTAWAERSLVDDFGLPQEKVRVVGIGHRPRHVDPDERDWSMPRFLFVGVNWKRKNGPAVVEAFMRVRERFPDASLDVVGGHPHIDAPGVTGHGLLLRERASDQHRLDRLFSRATAFVLPSLFAPAGIVYLEAASAGLPVIGTTSGGARDLLGAAMMAVDPYDTGALIRAMLELCDGDVARSRGERARLQVAGSSWQAVAQRIAGALLQSTEARQHRAD